jgi:hypothetical protein
LTYYITIALLETKALPLEDLIPSVPFFELATFRRCDLIGSTHLRARAGIAETIIALINLWTSIWPSLKNQLIVRLCHREQPPEADKGAPELHENVRHTLKSSLTSKGLSIFSKRLMKEFFTISSNPDRTISNLFHGKME